MRDGNSFRSFCTQSERSVSSCFDQNEVIVKAGKDSDANTAHVEHSLGKLIAEQRPSTHILELDPGSLDGGAGVPQYPRNGGHSSHCAARSRSAGPPTGATATADVASENGS